MQSTMMPPPPPPSVAPPPPPPNVLVATINQIEATLRTCLIERDDEIRAMMRCLIAQEHLFLEGPPGTAKSLLCTSLAQTITDAAAFEVLLTKFSTPEDLFGPISVQGLKNDKYVRITNGYMPTAHISFVDEIWKASSAILNTLLTLMQERRFDNGGTRVDCPLRIMIAASNEWPQGEELGAAFDRFLVRRVVRPVSRARLNDLMFADLPTPRPITTIAELDQANAQAMALPFSQAAVDAVGDILDELADNGIMVGDRRKRKAMKIARAEAWLTNAERVEPVHLEPLADVLWQDPIEQPAKALEIITRIANPMQAEVNRLLKEIDEIMQQVKGAPSESNVRESGKQKLRLIVERANDIGTERAIKLAKYAREQWSLLCADGLQLRGKLGKMMTGG